MFQGERPERSPLLSVSGRHHPGEQLRGRWLGRPPPPTGGPGDRDLVFGAHDTPEFSARGRSDSRKLLLLFGMQLSDAPARKPGSPTHAQCRLAAAAEGTWGRNRRHSSRLAEDQRRDTTVPTGELPTFADVWRYRHFLSHIYPCALLYTLYTPSSIYLSLSPAFYTTEYRLLPVTQGRTREFTYTRGVVVLRGWLAMGRDTERLSFAGWTPYCKDPSRSFFFFFPLVTMMNFSNATFRRCNAFSGIQIVTVNVDSNKRTSYEKRGGLV